MAYDLYVDEKNMVHNLSVIVAFASPYVTDSFDGVRTTSAPLERDAVWGGGGGRVIIYINSPRIASIQVLACVFTVRITANFAVFNSAYCCIRRDSGTSFGTFRQKLSPKLSFLQIIGLRHLTAGNFLFILGV